MTDGNILKDNFMNAIVYPIKNKQRSLIVLKEDNEYVLYDSFSVIRTNSFGDIKRLVDKMLVKLLDNNKK